MCLTSYLSSSRLASYHSPSLFSAPQSPKVDSPPNPVEIEQDVNSLYYSGQGKWGTDEKAFIDTVTKHGGA